MPSKPDIKDIIPLEPSNVALLQQDADQSAEHQSVNDAGRNVKFSSRSRRKTMIVVAVIVIVITVTGVLVGILVPKRLSNDEEDNYCE